MADDRRRSAGRRAALVLAALLAAALLAVTLAACGGDDRDERRPARRLLDRRRHQSGQMTMLQIAKDGDTYTVKSNPDQPMGDVKQDGQDLVVDTHVVKHPHLAAAAGQAGPGVHRRDVQGARRPSSSHAREREGVQGRRRGLRPRAHPSRARHVEGRRRQEVPAGQGGHAGRHARQDDRLAGEPVHRRADDPGREHRQLQLRAAGRRQEVLPEGLPRGRQHDRQVDAVPRRVSAAAGPSPAGSRPRRSRDCRARRPPRR